MRRLWDKAAIPVFSLDELLARCEVVTVVVDGGGLDDLLGLSVVGREIGTGRWLSWGRAGYIPSPLSAASPKRPNTLTSSRRATWCSWSASARTLKKKLFMWQIVDSGLLDKVGVDRLGLGAIHDALVGTEEEPGPVTADQVVGIPQGYQLNGAIKTAERHVAAKKLAHGGSALLAWCVGNAKTG